MDDDLCTDCRGRCGAFGSCSTTSSKIFAFDTVVGRYIALCFFASARDEHTQAAVAAVRSRPHFFDETMGAFFGVSLDPTDETERSPR